ncbi:MAG: pyridoxamine 5'-phosphate oxidase family protein [Ignavibacteriales bacterium]|nr:pyridoxamine 5'-phosphate oxidase family protein [Ignavibacteriales bacterium]
MNPNPFKQFNIWMDEAISSAATEPTAMVLATVGKNMQPSARMVLLKEIKPEGFVFYSNYESEKGNQIEENHYGSLLFYWADLEKQIRIEGRLKKLQKKYQMSIIFRDLLKSRSRILALRLRAEKSPTESFLKQNRLNMSINLVDIYLHDPKTGVVYINSLYF